MRRVVALRSGSVATSVTALLRAGRPRDPEAAVLDEHRAPVRRSASLPARAVPAIRIGEPDGISGARRVERDLRPGRVDREAPGLRRPRAREAPGRRSPGGGACPSGERRALEDEPALRRGTARLVTSTPSSLQWTRSRTLCDAADRELQRGEERRADRRSLRGPLRVEARARRAGRRARGWRRRARRELPDDREAARAGRSRGPRRGARAGCCGRVAAVSSVGRLAARSSSAAVAPGGPPPLGGGAARPPERERSISSTRRRIARPAARSSAFVPSCAGAPPSGAARRAGPRPRRRV